MRRPFDLDRPGTTAGMAERSLTAVPYVLLGFVEPVYVQSGIDAELFDEVRRALH